MKTTTPFPIENLPYGVISTPSEPTPRCATAFEDYAIDLNELQRDGFFDSIPGMIDGAFSKPALNVFASTPQSTQAEVRARLVRFLPSASEADKEKYFIRLSQVTNHLPMETANFSDFYCSLEHARNCSEIMGLEVNPNWYYIPSVYNGRTSSLRVSGQPIRRPWGVISGPGASSQATWSRSKRLDFELEMGVFLAKPLPAGQILDIRNAKEHVFGFVILNDWSARDIQGFEMAPLGPFHSKGFGTTISPWIITIEALSPVECPVSIPQSPPPLPHLAWKGDSSNATWDIELSARILRKGKTYHVTSTNLKDLYWTPYQQLTHLASAGEGLSTGDIFGTGTISNDRLNGVGEKSGLACLLERILPKNRLACMEIDGLEYLEDGDEVVIEGWCFHPQSGTYFGFGECRAALVPALDQDPMTWVDPIQMMHTAYARGKMPSRQKLRYGIKITVFVHIWCRKGWIRELQTSGFCGTKSNPGLSFIDRVNIGNARLLGLEKDLGLSGLRFNIALMCLFVSYCVVELPSNILCKIVGGHIYIPTLVLCFGIITMLTSLVEQKGGLYACRFLLGVFEGGISPGLVFMLALFYRRHELGVRTSIYISASSASGAFGGLLAIGLSRIPDWGLIHTWRNIFFFEGLVSVILAVVAFISIPSGPETARFLTESQKQVAVDRMRIDSAGRLTFADYVSPWFFFGNTCAQSFSLFSPSIISAMGYTKELAQLLSVGPYAAACVISIVVGYVSDRYHSRGWVIFATVPFGIAGMGMLEFLPTSMPGAKYGALYLAAPGIYAFLPLWLAWAVNNAATPTVKAASAGLVFTVGSLGGILAPWVYLPGDAPNYRTGHAIMFAFLFGSWVICIGMIIYIKWENRAREMGKRDNVLEGLGLEEQLELSSRHPAFRYAV
ncbi:hypothetical protein AFLA_006400 [Aspergillus flavus NRRL3357]|nr:hypothetical protein AFLA_006400 [Aspergillus flavus NRRL3357]